MRACGACLLVTACALLGPSPASAQSSAASEQRYSVVQRFDWGAGENELGRSGGHEDAPEGPMSFAVDAAGRVFVLDQVNARVLGVDPAGQTFAQLSLGRSTYQDLELGLEGELALLDRLGRPGVTVLDADGELVAELALPNPPFEHPGGLSGLFLQDDGIWLQLEHQRSFRLSNAFYQAHCAQPAEPCSLPWVAGFPGPHGKQLHSARLQGKRRIEVWTTDREAEVLSAFAELDFDMDISHIVALVPSADGRVVAVVHLMQEDPKSFLVTDERLELVFLDAELAEQGRQRVSPSVGSWEQFRSFVLGADGDLYQLAVVSDGLELRRWKR